jgi:hypothetical protein
MKAAIGSLDAGFRTPCDLCMEPVSNSLAGVFIPLLIFRSPKMLGSIARYPAPRYTRLASLEMDASTAPARAGTKLFCAPGVPPSSLCRYPRRLDDRAVSHNAVLHERTELLRRAADHRHPIVFVTHTGRGVQHENDGQPHATDDK